MKQIDLATITEDEGLRLFFDLSQKFGWAGTIFTREDASSTWETFQEDGSKLEAMPDEVWEAVRHTYYWRKGLPERLTEWGWDIVRDAVEEAIQPAPTA